MSDAGTFALSAKARDAIKTIVSNELAKQRPATRIAKVVGVDPNKRTLSVVFTGEAETNAVSVPYVSEVPAKLGQFVRIGGGTHDRYVDAVIGETLTQRRVENAESHISSLMEAVVGPGWDDEDPDLLPTDVLGYFTGVGDGISAAQTAADNSQKDVNIARANLAGTPTTDDTVLVGHDSIYDNASFIGYSKCYFIANTIANWDLPNSGTYEMAALAITAYNGVSVRQIASDGRYAVTVLDEGYYEFNVSAEFGAEGGSLRQVLVRLPDGTILLRGSDSPNGGSTSAHITGACIYVAAGTEIRFHVYTDDPDQTIAALGSHVSMKQISSAAPSAAIGTLDAQFTINFSRETIGPLRNNSGGFWPASRVVSPIAIQFGTVLAKIRYSGGAGNIWLMRNGVGVRTVKSLFPFSGLFSFVWTGPISTSDQFWFEADATGNYKADETVIRISGV